jgi:hypothetical protein
MTKTFHEHNKKGLIREKAWATSDWPKRKNIHLSKAMKMVTSDSPANRSTFRPDAVPSGMRTARLLFLFLLPALMLAAQAVLAALPGQVMVDPDNPMRFVYNRDTDGNGDLDPVFICGPGDPEDFLYRGTRNADGTRDGDQMALINNMRAQGVNSIYFQVIRSHGGDGDSTHNPYLGSDPGSSVLLEPILAQWDTWLTALDNAGIVMYFFFYDDGAQIWSGDRVDIFEEHLIETLVNRFEHLKHLVWVVGEEYSEAYSPARVSDIAARIRFHDDHNHPIANHQLSGLEFDHADDANLDQFALQYNNTTVVGLHTGMVEAWNKAAGRYGIMMAESADHGLNHRTLVRQKNWGIALGGAYVMVLRMDGSEEYNEKMQDCATLINFFEATNVNTMAPHDELANVGTWLLADPGRSYIAYRDSIGNFEIRGMTAGDYFLRWIDPITGNTFEQRRLLAVGTNTLQRPAGFSFETAVWITKLAQAPPLAIPPLLKPLLLKDTP